MRAPVAPRHPGLRPLAAVCAALAALLAAAGCGPRPPRSGGDGIARALAGLEARPLPPEAGGLRFVVLGDYQFMDEPSFLRVLEDADRADPDFAAHVGDMVLVTEANEPAEIERQWATFARRSARLRAPLLALPGNHDVGGPRTAAAWARVWGPMRCSFDRGGCHLVLLDSEAGARAAAAAGAEEPKTAAGNLGDEQLAWLEADLEAAAASGTRGVFVFMHRPLWNERKEWGPLHEMLRSHGVRAVFAGHTHVFRHEVRDGIDYVETVASRAGPEHLPSGRFAHAILAELSGDALRLEILHKGKRLSLEAVDPVAQRAWKERWTKLPRACLGTAPIDYRIELRNPLDRPALVRYAWNAGPEGAFEFDPPAGELELAPKESREVDFRVRPTAPETARRHLAGAPRLELEVAVEAPGGRTSQASPGYDLPLEADLPAVELPRRLPGRVALFERTEDEGGPGPLAWLLGQYGLAEGRDLVLAEGPEDLDRLLGTLRGGDALVVARSALVAQPELARRLVERTRALRAFLNDGGRMVAVLGGDEAAAPLLRDLGLRLVPYDRAWQTEGKGNNGMIELAGPEGPLLEGLVGRRIVYRSARMLDGWYQAAEPNAWRMLAANNLGGNAVLARPIGRGLVIASLARLDSAGHMRENLNQQRIWANLLLLGPGDMREFPRAAR